MDDLDLIQRIAGGDEKAMMTFYDRYFGLVAGYCRKLVHDRGVADEVIQDTFWQVWRTAAQYNSERGAPSTWILTMAKSRAVDRLRQLARRPQLDSLEDLAIPPPAPEGVTDKVEHRESMQKLAHGMARLPDEQRRMVQWVYLDGLTAVESARRENIPLGTAKTRLRLGLEKLRKTLLEVGPHDA